MSKQAMFTRWWCMRGLGNVVGPQNFEWSVCSSIDRDIAIELFAIAKTISNLTGESLWVVVEGRLPWVVRVNFQIRTEFQNKPQQKIGTASGVLPKFWSFQFSDCFLWKNDHFSHLKSKLFSEKLSSKWKPNESLMTIKKKEQNTKKFDKF